MFTFFFFFYLNDFFKVSSKWCLHRPWITLLKAHLWIRSFKKNRDALIVWRTKVPKLFISSLNSCSLNLVMIVWVRLFCYSTLNVRWGTTFNVPNTYSQGEREYVLGMFSVMYWCTNLKVRKFLLAQPCLFVLLNEENRMKQQ